VFPESTKQICHVEITYLARTLSVLGYLIVKEQIDVSMLNPFYPELILHWSNPKL